MCACGHTEMLSTRVFADAEGSVGLVSPSPASPSPASPNPASPNPASPSPASPVRYRCTACGNITRFDVVTDRRAKAFHHFSVGGELSVEDVEVLSETVVEVSCRWCGHGRAIEELDDDEGAPTTAPAETSGPPA